MEKKNYHFFVSEPKKDRIEKALKKKGIFCTCSLPKGKFQSMKVEIEIEKDQVSDVKKICKKFNVGLFPPQPKTQNVSC